MSDDAAVVDDPQRPDWPLGPFLTAARVRAGMSINEAARQAGVSHALVRQLERGYVIKGGKSYPISTTMRTVKRVAGAVRADTQEALRLVGITADDPSLPGRRATGVDLSGISNEALIAELARRLAIPETDR